MRHQIIRPYDLGAGRDHGLRTQASLKKLPGVGHSFLKCDSDIELMSRAIDFLLRPRRSSPMPLPRSFRPMF